MHADPDILHAASQYRMHALRPSTLTKTSIPASPIHSSIVSEHGGCFNEARSHRLQPVLVENTCALSPASVGYLANVMHVLNATWPNADHVLLNLGTPSFTFQVGTISHHCQWWQRM